MKVIIISLVLFFVVFKLINFAFRLLGVGKVQNQQQRYQHHARPNNRRPADGNVNVDYIPKDKKAHHGRNFNGGEYVDYEDVK
jgi:hypothetical protein